MVRLALLLCLFCIGCGKQIGEHAELSGYPSQYTIASVWQADVPGGAIVDYTLIDIASKTTTTGTVEYFDGVICSYDLYVSISSNEYAGELTMVNGSYVGGGGGDPGCGNINFNGTYNIVLNTMDLCSVGGCSPYVYKD